MTFEPPTLSSHRALMSAAPSSALARAAVAELANLLEDYEIAAGLRKYGRSSRADAYRSSLGAFVGELLIAQSKPDAAGWMSWPLSRSAYTELPHSYDDVKSAVEVLKALGFIEVAAGKPFLQKNFFVSGGPVAKSKGFTSMMRLNPKGLEWLRHRGLSPQSQGEHFKDGIPTNPLVLRGASRRVDGRKISGGVLRIQKTPKSVALAKEVQELNAFVSRFDIQPAKHRGFKRIFNEGDHQNFAWNRGGRLYSIGRGSYQSLSKSERLQMMIDGDPVVEIDISGSYLTILHGLLQVPFDPSADHYQVDGLDRELVKRWTVATLTSGRLVRWPRGLRDGYRKRTGLKIPPVSTVARAMEARYPVLAQLKDQQEFSWATFMWHESEIVIVTLRALMDAGIPALPVFDSVIVRVQDRDTALRELEGAFREVVGIQGSFVVHAAIP